MIGLNFLDKKRQVDTFILDFEKAFDTPLDELIKSKLFSYDYESFCKCPVFSFAMTFEQRHVISNNVAF